MACNSINLASIARDCDPNVGGIKKVWLHPWVEGIFSLDSGNTGVSGVTVDATTASTGTGWYTFEFRRGTGSLTSNLNIDDANGVNFIQSDLVLQFSRMETAKRTAVAALAVAEVAGIVLDNNGIYWALGFNEPMSSSAGVGQTGTARTDGNNYQVTLSDFSQSYPYEVDATIVAALKIASDNA